jgi:signal transduction histidine kinase
VIKTRRLFSASFRLTALYLALFTVSAAVIDGVVYVLVLRSQDRAFADRIKEESSSLVRLDRNEGRARLAAGIEARSAPGAALVYGLYAPDGKRLAGRSPLVAGPNSAPRPGWSEAPEADDGEAEEARPDVVRMLTTRLDDGAFLVVGDERTDIDAVMRDITEAFAWGLGAAVALGLAGGLWLSGQFLKRLEAMRNAARAVMKGDWRRRIPASAVEDDLAALARTFNRLFDRIEKLLLSQKHVGSDIAHDLRRPLANVLRELERARERHDEAAVERAIAGVEEVLQTFEALLRIGEIESGARRAAFAELDLSDLAEDVAEAFRPSAEEEGRALICRLECPTPMRGDAALLKQAIANLIDNALRHTARGVGIEVRTGKTAEGVRLEVSDHGAGVAEPDRANLFRRFFRADAARHAPGAGLGLALVAAIADLHDMDVAAQDNAPGLRVVLQSAARD